jgi:F-type H+-transporting ATPase subunit delta
MKNTVVAKRYADALFEVAEAQGAVDKVEQELAAITAALKEHPKLKHLLLHPGISGDVKKDQLVSLFGNHVSNIVTNFLKVLVDANRQDALEGIYAAYSDRVDQAKGRTKAYVETAVPLSEGELDLLKQKLAKNGGEVQLTTVVNPALIGGAKIRVGGRVFDYSVASQLDRFRQSLNY